MSADAHFFKLFFPLLPRRSKTAWLFCHMLIIMTALPIGAMETSGGAVLCLQSACKAAGSVQADQKDETYEKLF